MAEMKRKEFLTIALGLYILWSFISSAPVNQSVLQDRYNGNLTAYLINESSSIGSEFLDVAFNGFRGVTTWLNDHTLYVTLGIGILLIGFIGFKK